MFQTTNLCRKIDTALKTANGFATASAKPSNTSNTEPCDHQLEKKYNFHHRHLLMLNDIDLLNQWKFYDRRFHKKGLRNCLFEFITKADSSQFSPAVSHSSNRVGIIVRSQFGHVYRQTTI